MSQTEAIQPLSSISKQETDAIDLKSIASAEQTLRSQKKLISDQPMPSVQVLPSEGKPFSIDAVKQSEKRLDTRNFLFQLLEITDRILKQQSQLSTQMKEQKRQETRDYEKLSKKSCHLIKSLATTSFRGSFASLVMSMANAYINNSTMKIAAESFIPQGVGFLTAWDQSKKQSFDHELNRILNELNAINTERQSQGGINQEALSLVQTAAAAFRVG